jgi:hypothetical protein
LAQNLPFSIYYEEGNPEPTPLRIAISEQDVINFHTAGKCNETRYLGTGDEEERGFGMR